MLHSNIIDQKAVTLFIFEINIIELPLIIICKAIKMNVLNCLIKNTSYQYDLICLSSIYTKGNTSTYFYSLNTFNVLQQAVFVGLS